MSGNVLGDGAGQCARQHRQCPAATRSFSKPCLTGHDAVDGGEVASHADQPSATAAFGRLGLTELSRGAEVGPVASRSALALSALAASLVSLPRCSRRRSRCACARRPGKRPLCRGNRIDGSARPTEFLSRASARPEESRVRILGDHGPCSRRCRQVLSSLRAAVRVASSPEAAEAVSPGNLSGNCLAIAPPGFRPASTCVGGDPQLLEALAVTGHAPSMAAKGRSHAG